MHRIYDAKLKAYVHHIYVGEFHIGKGKDIISTVLGSCIAICLFDKKVKVGGMIHYLLPESGSSILDKKQYMYGDNLFDVLVSALKRRGAQKESMVAKIIGGSNIMDRDDVHGVGTKNIIFAQKILKKYGIKVEKEDVGGGGSRKIIYYPGLNKAFVKEVKI